MNDPRVQLVSRPIGFQGFLSTERVKTLVPGQSSGKIGPEKGVLYRVLLQKVLLSKVAGSRLRRWRHKEIGSDQIVFAVNFFVPCLERKLERGKSPSTKLGKETGASFCSDLHMLSLPPLTHTSLRLLFLRKAKRRSPKSELETHKAAKNSVSAFCRARKIKVLFLLR